MRRGKAWLVNVRAACTCEEIGLSRAVGANCARARVKRAHVNRGSVPDRGSQCALTDDIVLSTEVLWLDAVLVAFEALNYDAFDPHRDAFSLLAVAG